MRRQKYKVTWNEYIRTRHDVGSDGANDEVRRVVSGREKTFEDFPNFRFDSRGRSRFGNLLNKKIEVNRFVIVVAIEPEGEIYER